MAPIQYPGSPKLRIALQVDFVEYFSKIASKQKKQQKISSLSIF